MKNLGHSPIPGSASSTSALPLSKIAITVIARPNSACE